MTTTRLQTLKALYEMIAPSKNYRGGTANLSAEELGDLLEVVDAAQELCDLLHDLNYQADSFTLQPLKLTLAKLEESTEEVE